MPSAAVGDGRLGLALFFSDGMSLAGWQAAGILGRELALYRALAGDGIDTTLVTYGRRDRAVPQPGGAMAVRENGAGLPLRVYRALLPWLHGAALRRCDVFKTNQLNGAPAALRCARRLGRPLVARGGYLWSEFTVRQRGADSGEARRAREAEDHVFRHAAHVVVTTAAMRDTVCARVPGAEDRVTVIPNYVDTVQFAPAPGSRADTDVLYVGRLERQKNVESLLQALAGSGHAATLIGSGSLGERLRAVAEEAGVGAKWLERAPHEALPAHMRAARVFVLPSHYEGHPKTLIEAMACGCAVLGADSPGIREMIRHGDTGWLCAPQPDAIRGALSRLLGDAALRARLGAAARRWACEHYSLARVAALEAQLLTQVAGAWRRP